MHYLVSLDFEGRRRPAEKRHFSRYVDTKGQDLDWHQSVEGFVLLAKLIILFTLALSTTVTIIIYLQ